MKLFLATALCWATASAINMDALKKPYKLRTEDDPPPLLEPIDPTSKTKLFSTNTDRRWPGNVVPYTIDAGFTDDEIYLIEASMASIEVVSCITFRPKEVGDDDWVRIKHDESGCFATLGHTSGENVCNLDRSSCMVSEKIFYLLRVT